MKRYTEQELADVFHSITREGLWTPWSGVPRREAAPLAVGVYLRYSDLVPGVSSLKERYWEALQKVPNTSTVVMLSMINGILSSGSADLSLHAVLNEQFLTGDLKGRVAAYRREDPAPTVVFNRVGCLQLIRHLLVYGTIIPAGGASPQTQNLGELVLLANEFLYDDSLPLPAQPSDLDVAALAAPTWDIYNPRDLAYAMSRMHTMLREILPGNDKQVRALSKAAGIDPNQITIDGIPLVDFLAVVFGLYSRGQKMTTDVRSALFDIGEIFKKIGPTGALQQFMAARSLTPSQFREQVGEGGEPSRDKFFHELESRSFIKGALVDFRRRPLLMLDDKRAVILDLQFLVELLTVGVYYSIFDTLPKDRRDRFREMWGRIFELYAVGLLREAYPEGLGFLQTDAEFPGGQIDALVDFGEEVLAFEMKSSLLTEVAKRGGRSKTFETDVYKKFVRNEKGEPKGVAQLAKSCRAIVEGTLKTTLRPPQVYPILLSEEPACEALCFNSYLNGIFWSELGTSPNVRPLSVMSINEFEEVLGQVSAGVLTWPSLLNTRFDHENVVPVSVHQALYTWLRSKGIKAIRNEARRAKFEKAAAEILQRYQSTPG